MPGRDLEQRAAFVCQSCHARKKACDKRLPTCSHCARRGLDCHYSDKAPTSISKAIATRREGTLSTASSPTARVSERSPRFRAVFSSASLADLQASIRIQVSQILPFSQDFNENLGAQYFRGPHTWLPFLSRECYYNGFHDDSGEIAADFGLLLLAMRLLLRNVGDSQHAIDHAAVHVVAKTHFVQLQMLIPPSRRIICAGILLAWYEYAVQLTDVALATLSMTSRLAYAADLHLYPSDDRANNIWWALVICERIFVCDAHPHSQGFTTPFLANDRPLPYDAGILFTNESRSSTKTREVDALGRAAQAASYLERFLALSRKPCGYAELEEAHRLDVDLQSFLSAVLNQSRGAWGAFSCSTAMSLRVMFLLHNHILAQDIYDEQKSTSYAALDTATRIISDVIDALPGAEINSLHPSSFFVVQSAVAHLKRSTKDLSDPIRPVERLEKALEMVVASWTAGAIMTPS